MGEEQHVLHFLERLIEGDVGQAVKILETTPRFEVSALLQQLSVTNSAALINRLQTSFAAGVLDLCGADHATAILSALPPNKAATLAMYLSKSSREKFLPGISGKLAEKIRELYTYPEGSVGRIMSIDYLSFREEDRVEDAIHTMREFANKHTVPSSYMYVVDDDGILKGVLNMRDLLFSDSDSKLSEIMIRDVFTLHCFTDCTEATRELAKRKYFAAPIVDSEERMLGVIKAENMLTGLKVDVTSDLLKMVGAGGDERTFSPISFALKKRLVWLHVNLATAFLAAAVVSLFEDVIAKITVLAVFLPVIAGQGGNAGAQSLAVVMRGLVMREIPPGRVVELIRKETLLGAINGIVIGIVTAIIGWLWNGNPWFGLVIGLGMIANLVIAGFAGCVIPLIMKRIGVDPAQSSSIILTTVTDVMGFLAFLGLAVLFQNYLIG